MLGVVRSLDQHFLNKSFHRNKQHWNAEMSTTNAESFTKLFIHLFNLYTSLFIYLFIYLPNYLFMYLSYAVLYTTLSRQPSKLQNKLQFVDSTLHMHAVPVRRTPCQFVTERCTMESLGHGERMQRMQDANCWIYFRTKFKEHWEHAAARGPIFLHYKSHYCMSSNLF